MGDFGGSGSRAFWPYVYAAHEYTWVVTPLGSRRFKMPLRQLSVVVLALVLLLAALCKCWRWKRSSIASLDRNAKPHTE